MDLIFGASVAELYDAAVQQNSSRAFRRGACSYRHLYFMRSRRSKGEAGPNKCLIAQKGMRRKRVGSCGRGRITTQRNFGTSTSTSISTGTSSTLVLVQYYR
jgi:hypothetical protein